MRLVKDAALSVSTDRGCFSYSNRPPTPTDRHPGILHLAWAEVAAVSDLSYLNVLDRACLWDVLLEVYGQIAVGSVRTNIGGAFPAVATAPHPAGTHWNLASSSHLLDYIKAAINLLRAYKSLDLREIPPVCLSSSTYSCLHCPSISVVYCLCPFK